MLVKSPAVSRAIVFTLTKSTANKVATALTEAGAPAEAIHGKQVAGPAGTRPGRVQVRRDPRAGRDRPRIAPA